MSGKDSNRQINASCLTDIGLVRRCNEDACSANPEHNFFTVADGIGGAVAGDAASRIFLSTTAEIFKASRPQSENEAKELVTACFAEANQAIQQHIQFTPAHKGMGCTAELLVTCGDRYVLGHIGDSRTYLYINGELELLTTDHSVVQEQLQMGLISSEQAENSRFKNVLSRAVGIDRHISADIHSGPLPSNALFLLCSDGLYNMVSAEKIIPVLQYNAPLSLKTEMLINMANDAGGKDNISVCLVEISS